MTPIQYKVILVRGKDAFDFLQGQLTNDLRKLRQDAVLLTAWCNPKGRVICVFRVRKIENGYALTLPAELGESVVHRLTIFRFRAIAEFELQDTSLAELGAATSMEDWRLSNLRAGIPEIRTAQSEQFTPHMLCLDRLDAISLDKGCYTGQEIVARTHYRGATKRRMSRYESDEPVVEGAEVFDGDRKVGDVVNAIGTDLLAVVPVDKKDSTLTTNGTRLVGQPLPYD